MAALQQNTQDILSRLEALGPAERMIATLTQYIDHLYHNRPGVVSSGAGDVPQWMPCTHVKKEGACEVYRLEKQGNKTRKILVGVVPKEKIEGGDLILNSGRAVGYYMAAGIFSEVASFLWKQILAVWKMDNELSARWASYAFAQEHKDMKILLAAFMLVQSRKGDPVRDEEGKALFSDDDFREVGEAMALIRKKNQDISPKHLLRLFEILEVPEIAEMNRKEGFGTSPKRAPLGRLPKVVTKWLRFRENNIDLLKGLVKAGYRQTVMALAQKVGYKPQGQKFFEELRWKQRQSEDGRRVIGLDMEVSKAESWEGLSEEKICEKITEGKRSWKQITGMLPSSVGVTRAVVAAAIMSGSMSRQDLVIMTPTLEELGLLNVNEIRQRWELALASAENMRSANIAKRVKSEETAAKLQEAAETALKKAVASEVKNLRIYVMVDKSGSMENALEKAKEYLTKMLVAFPLDKIHVCTFNTSAKMLSLKHASKAGVEQAFRGEGAGGGTVYSSAVQLMAEHPPKEDEEALFFFIGDEGDSQQHFAPTVERSGLKPVAFLLLNDWVGGVHSRESVKNTARILNIPCINVDTQMFEDVYALPRTLSNLIASTPVSKVQSSGRAVVREGLLEKILKTDLLSKPSWA